MIVSDQSWHLRYVRWWQPESKKHEDSLYMPRDLCSYFWRVVWTIVGPPLGFGMLLVWLGFIIFWIIDDWVKAVIVIGSTVGIVVLIIGLVIASIVIFNRDPKPKKPRKPKAKKEPGLLRSYLSAKKRRVCPLIEVAKE